MLKSVNLHLIFSISLFLFSNCLRTKQPGPESMEIQQLKRSAAETVSAEADLENQYNGTFVIVW